MRILHAFYDLAISPCSYDFFIFLQLAELQRLRYKLDAYYIHFVAGPCNGFRKDDLPVTLLEKEMMLKNTLIPACHLFPSCAGVTFFRQRTELHALDQMPFETIYPLGYRFDSPCQGHLVNGINAAILRGEKIQPFAAPNEHVKMIDDFILHKAKNRKLITINLREGIKYPARNSNINAWSEFCKSLNKEFFYPVLIRESSKINQPIEGFDESDCSSLAAVDIRYRVAMYKKSYINLFVPTGPILASWLSGSNTILLKPHDENSPLTNQNWYNIIYGLKLGEQIPFLNKLQRIYWADDSLENITACFHEMIDSIESDSAKMKNDSELKIEIEKNDELFIGSVLRHLQNRFLKSVTIEDALCLKCIQEIYGEKKFKSYLNEICSMNSDKILPLLKLISNKHNMALSIE